ncbi:LOW QUALITY PROTEIN: hypothetical protein PHMEG_00027189 [Phytophthora megakarya]|uniref:Retrotransposon gag domain-containing protein n=1 Tax=Phytophthora megakarya TaxID=4795 RepID=A0A225V7S5_9STRA|nr:LOW QUALITY PROTEIN: hypothetical protein PHMEG_00027189 [Phytophthora megakarya]
MTYEQGHENLPMDGMSVGSPNTAATHVMRADCPHLADPEWEALQRLSTVIGEAAVATMLRTLSPTEQHGVALGFILSEQREVAAANTVSPKVTPRNEYLKLHVSNYEGKEALHYHYGSTYCRPTVEGCLFAVSCLGGRARSWAYGRRLADPTCFSTYEPLQKELKLAFESPKNEFRSRAEFLDLQQGTQDVHAYAQRARYLVSNVVTKPMDETTFMKGLKDGPVKTYLFREYPSTLEAAITLAMHEEVSLRQAKLHVNVPLPPEPAVEVADEVEGPEPMDLSSAIAAGQQGTGANVRCFRVLSRLNKQRDGPVGAGRPTGNAVTRVNNGHAGSHCKVQDDKSILVILKMTSMTKRADSFRVLGRVEQLVRQQRLPLLDFEEKHVPRSQLEVRLATDAIVKTEKLVINARFSYQHRVVVEELLDLDLDGKFDMVLGMPWLARHDPIIDWETRTTVRFGRRGATDSDGLVSAADTPNGASESPSETGARAAVSGRSAWSVWPVTTPGVVDRRGVSGQGPHTTKKFSAVRRRGANSVSTPGVDTHSISKSREFSAVRRRGDNGVSTPGVAAHCSAPGCTKQGAIKPGLMTRACGYKNPLAIVRRLECLPVVSRNIRPWPGLNETQVNPGFTRRSDGANTRHCASLGPGPRPFMPTVAVKTLNVLTRACNGYQYEKMELENFPTDTSKLTSLPVMSWKRFAKYLYDERIEQLCILSDRERNTSEAEELRQLFAGSVTESEDTLSAKTKNERFEDQSWDSPKSIATVAGSSEVRDTFLVFGARLRTELLLHDIRSQPAVDGKKKRARKWTAAWSQPLYAVKLGLAAAPILAVVVQDRPMSRTHPIS